MENPVTVKTYTTRLEAEVDRSYLKANGITAFITADDAGGAYPFPFTPSPSGVELKVWERDLEKAKKLLELEKKIDCDG